MIVFFFSSRRRHTRFDCDWSSDVCSSDLQQPDQQAHRDAQAMEDKVRLVAGHDDGAHRLRSLLHILRRAEQDRKSTRLNSSHSQISYAVFCLKKKKKKTL